MEQFDNDEPVGFSAPTRAPTDRPAASANGKTEDSARSQARGPNPESRIGAEEIGFLFVTLKLTRVCLSTAPALPALQIKSEWERGKVTRLAVT
jgi:hypothetical protein